MVAGTDKELFKVNIGLCSAATEVTGAAEGDLWYSSTLGAVKGAALVSTNVGPSGTHPVIFGGTTFWYPLQKTLCGSNTLGPTNNRAYAYLFYPGRKCTLNDFAMRITTTGGAGNLRMALYDSDATTGLPGALIADYGTKTAASGGAVTVQGWTVGTTVQPIPYWVVLMMQTTVAPTMTRYHTYSPLVPWPVAVPTFAASDQVNCVYSDTGFSGAPPDPFGAVVSAILGPTVWAKIA